MKQAHILVVDDEKDLREALAQALTHAGHKVTTAEDGTTGLMEARKSHPDLILLDIMMPEMSGHQVLRELRKDPWGEKVHVLLLTNADDPDNVAHGVELRSNDYIIKSQTSLEEIAKRVKQHLFGYHD